MGKILLLQVTDKGILNNVKGMFSIDCCCIFNKKKEEFMMFYYWRGYQNLGMIF